MPDATANGCSPAAAVGDTKAEAVGSVAVSSPTIFQYPRQPARDDGRMLALASLIGGVLDAVIGGDAISDAQDAENTWKSILDNVFKPRGESLLQRYDTELAKLPDVETDMRNQLADYRAKADTMWPELAPLHQLLKDEIAEQRGKSTDEFNYADTLCTTDAMTKLCEFVACGYNPDYTGIATRARADAEIAAQNTFEQMCRVGNRYNMRRTQHALTEIRMATMSAAVGATAAAREKERMFAFETNYKLRFELAKAMESFRLGRKQLALEYDKLAISVAQDRWNAIARLYLDLEKSGDQIADGMWRKFFEHAYKALNEGGQMLASAAQSYQFLAASIRASAKQGAGGGIAGALAMLATVIPMFSGDCEQTNIFGVIPFYPRPKECCTTT